MRKKLYRILACLSFVSLPLHFAVADEGVVRADSHGPIGVMGDHMHKAGEWMISYRYMHMEMAGNRFNGGAISPDTIVTSIPNRFAGMPMQPPTLRVVPLWMDMDMHMFGGMYAPTDWLTLMVMGTYISKEMSHRTYQGPSGTAIAGNFVTRTSDLGDTSVNGLFRIFDTENAHIHMHFGVGLPTGSNTNAGAVLSPMGTTPVLRFPYAMQVGSGTYDLRPGLTYTGRSNDLTWGLQYTSIVRFGRDNGYRLGDHHKFTGWAAYQIEPWISISARMAGEMLGEINGIDSAIIAPVQTADPANYGGEAVTAFLGINLAGQEGALRGHRLGIEVGIPVMRHLNGLQMEVDWQITVGWQKSF